MNARRRLTAAKIPPTLWLGGSAVEDAFDPYGFDMDVLNRLCRKYLKKYLVDCSILVSPDDDDSDQAILLYHFQKHGKPANLGNARGDEDLPFVASFYQSPESGKTLVIDLDEYHESNYPPVALR